MGDFSQGDFSNNPLGLANMLRLTFEVEKLKVCENHLMRDFKSFCLLPHVDLLGLKVNFALALLGLNRVRLLD